MARGIFHKYKRLTTVLRMQMTPKAFCVQQVKDQWKLPCFIKATLHWVIFENAT